MKTFILLACVCLTATAQDSVKTKPVVPDTIRHILTVESFVQEWNNYIEWTEKEENYFVYDWQTKVNIHPKPDMPAFILWLSKKYRIPHGSLP